MTRERKKPLCWSNEGTGLIPVVLAALIAFAALWDTAHFASGAPPKGPSYTIVKLSDANGAYSDTFPNDVNNLGHIVGQVWEGDVLRAAYWELTTSGGAIQSTLRILTGEMVSAHAINDAEEIVGDGIDSTGAMLGLYWSGPADDPIVLPPLAGHDRSNAVRINNDGVICGYSMILSQEETRRAVAWRVNRVGGSPLIRGPIALPDVGTGSRADSINDNDAGGIATIAGALETTQAAAVAWSVQSLPDGTLAVASAPDILDPDALANGINNSDAVCGYLFGSPVEAVVWSGSSRRILNRAKFVTAAWANGISNSGVIVGAGNYRRSSEQGTRATVWPSATGSMILLDNFLLAGSPFSHLQQALVVNDQGLISGYGWMANTRQYGAFVAVPR